MLRLAAAGDLYALPSPVPRESVLLVYHLPENHAGTHGDHADAVYLRQLVHQRLVDLAEPALMTAPNGDLHQLRHVTVTSAGEDWLVSQLLPEEPADLRPVDTRERVFTTPGWGCASWSGTARMH